MTRGVNVRLELFKELQTIKGNFRAKGNPASSNNTREGISEDRT